MAKNNTISVKKDVEKASKIIKEEQSQKFAGGNARGTSIDKLPIVPVGPVIMLEYNMSDSGIIGIDAKDRKVKHQYWTVIGIGGTVSTVNIGDKLILKPTADVETFITDNLDELGIEEFGYHVIYEHAILGIIK